MVSFETCKKLQEEIISLIGDNLLEDDEPFLNLLSQSNDSKGVLDLASELKAAGISYYKDGKLDDALEKYGYAAMILARYHFEEECDRLEFLKLAINTLMNSVLCFSKKKEYVEVGRICSIVLEFDPYNVKAMYRRAMAALELGKRDWARLDLWMALDVDPNNKEVIKKLEELKDTPSKENSLSQCNGAIPTGLGIGLSPPKHKKNEVADKEKAKLKGDPQGIKDNKRDEGHQVLVKSSIGVQEEGGDDHSMATKQEDEEEELQRQALSIIEANEEKKELVADNIEQSNELLQNEMLVDKSSLSEEDKMSCVSTKEVDQSSPCVQPRYRYRSTKRHGFMLSISKHDYRLLTQGRSLKYFDAKSGSFMEIRLPSRSNEGVTEDSGISLQQKVQKIESGNHLNVDNDRRKINPPMEKSSDNLSCVTYSGSCYNEGEVCSSHPNNHSFFYFSAQPKPTIRKRNGARSKCHGSFVTPEKGNKRRKSQDNQPTLLNVCKCRPGQRNKRKGEHPFPLDSYHHLRKKGRCSLLPGWMSYSHTQDPGYCNATSNVGTNRSRDMVSSCISVRSSVDSTISCSNVNIEMQGSTQVGMEETSGFAVAARM